MSADNGPIISMDVDAAFLKSKRGILKAAELVTLFAAFVCFTVASGHKYITATVLELLITSLLLSLYLFKLNKRLTFFFWPLVDVCNSVFAVVYFLVLSLLAMTTHTVTGTLVGGIFALVLAALLSADGYILLRNITFNQQRGQSQSPDNQ